MRPIATRIVAALLAFFIALAGALISFAFFCYAVFASLASYLSPALAALVTASLIFLPAILIIVALGFRARSRKHARQTPFPAGEVLEDLLAQSIRNLAARNLGASLLMALLSGLVIGASASSRRA